MKKPKTINDLLSHIQKFCPNASISADDDGQIIVNTAKKAVSKDAVLVDLKFSK